MVLKRSRLILFLAAICSAYEANAVAANPGAPIVFPDRDAITASFVNAPVLSSSGGGDEGQWLKVEFQYAVIPPAPAATSGGTPPPAAPFVDAVEFKVWIEARDMYAANAPGAEGVAVLLTGSVTYINVAKNRTAYGVVYVHPSTIARYSGSGGTADFDRKFNIHIDASVGGTLVDYIDKFPDKGGKDWYKAIPTTIPNLVYRQDQTSFLVSDVAKYPAIKLPAASQ